MAPRSCDCPPDVPKQPALGLGGLGVAVLAGLGGRDGGRRISLAGARAPQPAEPTFKMTTLVRAGSKLHLPDNKAHCPALSRLCNSGHVREGTREQLQAGTHHQFAMCKFCSRNQ
eukprot:m51a1_g2967 hypothetical protein (115) ;mRNA; f:694930-695357